MKRIRCLLALVAGLPCAAVSAQTPLVDAARAAGVIGERYDGYVGIAGQASVAVRNEVSTINIQRRSLYSNLAGTRGIAPSYVGLAAGCQLLGRVAIGEAYMLNDGKWRRRAPGQAVPTPNYCR